MLPKIHAMEIGYRDLPQKEQVSDSGLRDQAKHHQVLQRQKDTEKDTERQRDQMLLLLAACCTVIAWTVCA
jgi:hypothetical protein